MPAHRHDATSKGGCGDKATAAILSGLLTLSLPMAGCTSSEGVGVASEATSDGVTSVVSLKKESEIPTDGSPLNLIDISDLWSKRDLDGTYDESSATMVKLDGNGMTASGTGKSAVSTDGNELVISADGTYVLTGKADDMTVMIDAPDDAKVQLVLAGATIGRDGYAGICAKSADKVFLTVADGTKNSVASTGDFSSSDESVDGAIFAKCDLTVNGTGQLAVSAESAHGIVCKDDLVLASSDTGVVAGKHAIQAKDSVSVKDGTWNLTGGKDAIHSENDEDQSKGWIYVAGGNLVLTAESDGMDSNSWLQIDGGKIVVNAADDAMHAELDLAINGGTIDIQSCTEGIEGGTVTVTDGDVSVVSDDDGINATGDPNDEGDGNTRFFGMGGFGSNRQGNQDGQAEAQDGTNDTPSKQDATDSQTRPQDEASQTGGSDKNPDRQGDSDREGGRPDGEMVVPPTGGEDTQTVPPEGFDGMNPPDGFDGMAPPDGMTPPEGFEGITPPDGMDFPNDMTPPEGNGDGESSGVKRQPDGEDATASQGTDSKQKSTPDDKVPAESDATSSDGGKSQSDKGGNPGGFAGMMMGATDTAIVTVTGGRLVVDSRGDGIDSNGIVHFTGGETYVYGPVSEANTALDYGTDMRIDGGTVVAVGSAGMVENISSSSKQPSLTVFLEESTNGAVSVADGNAGIVSCSPTKGYSAVTVSTPEMTVDGEYEIACGDELQVVQMDGIATTSGTKGGMFGGRGGFAGEADQPRDGFARPEDLVGQQFGNGRHGDQGDTE